MKSAEFIALSACTMMLTALGIDIMLPVFATLRTHFGLSETSTQTAQIISFFFLGQVAQIFFGTLSDRYGRLAILRIGFPLYIAGGVAAAFAPTLPWMFAMRFIAGMGASAVFMTTIAGIRDRFAGDKMARMLSLVFTLFLFTPVIAPFLGIAILHIGSWRMVFLTPPLFAVIVFVWSLRLQESLPPDKRMPLRWANIFNAIKGVISNKTFLRYSTTTTLLFAGLSSYVASSEHIAGSIYGRPQLFPWIFAGMGLFMSFCTLMNARLSSAFGAKRTIRVLVIAYTVTAAVLVVVTIIHNGHPSMAFFFITIALLMAINLTIEPNSSALALEPMGDKAGVAAAVYGTYFFAAGASAGAVISGMIATELWPLVTAFFVIGVIAVALVFSDKRKI